MNRGLAAVTFESDNRVTVERVRNVIRDNGFTPKAAEVRLRGTLVSDSGALVVQQPGVGTTMRLAAHPDAPAMLERIGNAGAGATVVIEGVVPETAKGSQGPDVLQVRSFSLPPARSGRAARRDRHRAASGRDA